MDDSATSDRTARGSLRDGPDAPALEASVEWPVSATMMLRIGPAVALAVDAIRLGRSVSEHARPIDAVAAHAAHLLAAASTYAAALRPAHASEAQRVVVIVPQTGDVDPQITRWLDVLLGRLPRGVEPRADDEDVDLTSRVYVARGWLTSVVQNADASPDAPVWSVLIARFDTPFHVPTSAPLLHAWHRASIDADVAGEAHSAKPSGASTAPGPGGPLDALSKGERETVDLLLTGKSEAAIARLLGKSRHTIHSHVKRIYRKLRVASRAQLMARLLRSDGRSTPRTTR